MFAVAEVKIPGRFPYGKSTSGCMFTVDNCIEAVTRSDVLHLIYNIIEHLLLCV